MWLHCTCNGCTYTALIIAESVFSVSVGLRHSKDLQGKTKNLIIGHAVLCCGAGTYAGKDEAAGMHGAPHGPYGPATHPA